MAALDKALVKAGARFQREHRGTIHTVDVVKVKGGGLAFKDGTGAEFATLSAAAKKASGWASCNGLHFYRQADTAQTPAQARAVRKAVKDVATPTVEAVADVVFPGLNDAVAEQVAQGVGRGRRTAKKPGTTRKAATGTRKRGRTRQQRDSK